MNEIIKVGEDGVVMTKLAYGFDFDLGHSFFVTFNIPDILVFAYNTMILR